MFFGKQKYLGIDFGTSAIKAVELEPSSDGMAILTNYAEVSLASINSGKMHQEYSYDDELVLYLKALLERLNPDKREAFMALPAFVGLVTLIELPDISAKEMDDAIRFEAHKYVPSNLAEVSLSWEVVRRKAVTGTEGNASVKKVDVLLVAALNKEINRYNKYAAGANLSLRFLELETFSLARSVVGKDAGTSIVIDIGSKATNIILIEDGVVQLSRNIGIGGQDMTRTIAQSMNISLDRAEEMKRSSQDFLNVSGSSVVFPALDIVVTETNRIMQSYTAQAGGKKVEKIVLSGGSSHLTGLTSFLSQSFGVSVVLANPWKRIIVRDTARAAVDALGSSFSVALGLALGGIDGIDGEKE
jgi:type IV pilus assembly protein PilM